VKRGDIMAISKENVRVLITIEKDLKIKLEQQAEEQNRSFSNMIETVLKDYVKKKKSQNEDEKSSD
jgi:predicted transcriptional regulator